MTRSQRTYFFPSPHYRLPENREQQKLRVPSTSTWLKPCSRTGSSLMQTASIGAIHRRSTWRRSARARWSPWWRSIMRPLMSKPSRTKAVGTSSSTWLYCARCSRWRGANPQPSRRRQQSWKCLMSPAARALPLAQVFNIAGRVTGGAAIKSHTVGAGWVKAMTTAMCLINPRAAADNTYECSVAFISE